MQKKLSFIKLIENSISNDIVNPDDIINNLNSVYLNDILKINPILVEKKNIICENNTNIYYERMLIYKNESISIYLLKWQPGSETLIHNHDFKDKKCFCYFYVLSGNFQELIYDIDKEKYYIGKENFYTSDNYSFINDKNYTHKLKNLDKNISYTLHIYPQ